jgi:hypothetical protein
MSKIIIQYTGSEALEMLQTHFPKTWEDEINEGRDFIMSLMRMYKLSAFDAYAKFMKICGSNEKAISTLAALHVMNLQMKIGNEIKECQQKQLNHGNQASSLEQSESTSWEDKKTLRSYYISKQNELQQQIDELIKSYPVIGAKKVVVQTNIFDN